MANETLSWSDVLEPHGWRCVTGSDPAGRGREEVWERPGKPEVSTGEPHERSAVVYADRPGLLVVYSDSPLCGFAGGLRGSGRRGDGAGVGCDLQVAGLGGPGWGGRRHGAARLQCRERRQSWCRQRSWRGSGGRGRRDGMGGGMVPGTGVGGPPEPASGAPVPGDRTGDARRWTPTGSGGGTERAATSARRGEERRPRSHPSHEVQGAVVVGQGLHQPLRLGAGTVLAAGGRGGRGGHRRAGMKGCCCKDGEACTVVGQAPGLRARGGPRGGRRRAGLARHRHPGPLGLDRDRGADRVGVARRWCSTSARRRR